MTTKTEVFTELLKAWEELERTQIYDRGDLTTEFSKVPDDVADWRQRYEEADA